MILTGPDVKVFEKFGFGMKVVDMRCEIVLDY